MTSTIFLSLLVTLFLDSLRVQALRPDIPQQTSIIDTHFDPRGWSPRPTDNPSQHPSHIFKRQNFPNFPGDAGSIIVAPDATCGYISGLQGAPYSCSSQYKCLLFSATGGSYGPLACCSSGMSCKIRTACVASTDFYGPSSESFCNAGCKLDLYTLKCTNSAEPYCGQVRFTSPNIQDFWCISSSASTIYSVGTTFTGQPQRVFTTVDKTDLWPEPTSRSASSSSSWSSLSSSSATSEENSTPTSDDTVKPPSPTPTSKSKPVGAIIGGTLGGIAVIAIIGIGAFLLYSRYRNRRHQALNSTLPPHDPYEGYRQPSELNTFGQQQGYSMNPGQGYTDQHQNAQQRYYDPPKPVSVPQELYAAPNKLHDPVELAGRDVSGYDHR